jgi:hypothetical protein
MDPNHHRIYQQARAYDVAFGFRDIAAECNTLDALARRHTGRPAAAVLELAAGPARHAREFARRGVAATALDSMPSMRHYALQRAAHEGVDLTAVCADMCDFQLPQRFDLAILPMDSSSYLLDNAAVLRHLACVSRHLSRRRPLCARDDAPARCLQNRRRQRHSKWTAEEDGLRVEVQWGADGDAFDPIAQVDEVTVTMDVVRTERQRAACRTRSAAPHHGQRVRRARPRRRPTSTSSSGLGRWRPICRSATKLPPGAWCPCCARRPRPLEADRAGLPDIGPAAMRST